MLFDSRFERDNGEFSVKFHYLLDGRTFFEFPDMITFCCHPFFRLVLDYALKNHPFVSPHGRIACFDSIVCTAVYSRIDSVNSG